MSDLEGSFGEFKKTFQQLPEEVKVKIGCEVVGSLGTSGVIAFLTAGSGSPLLAKAIAQATLKVSKLLPTGQAETAAKMVSLAKNMEEKARTREAIIADAKKNGDLYKRAKKNARNEKEAELLFAKHGSPYQDIRNKLPFKEFVEKSKDEDLKDWFKYTEWDSDYRIEQLAGEIGRTDPKFEAEIIGYLKDRHRQRILNGYMRSHKEWLANHKEIPAASSAAGKASAVQSATEATEAVDLSSGQLAVIAVLAAGGPCTTAASVASKASQAQSTQGNSSSGTIGATK